MPVVPGDLQAMIHLLIWAWVFMPLPSWGQASLVAEPFMKAQTSWAILPNGMLVVEYDLNNNGRPDLFAVHVVTSSYFSNEGIHQIKSAYPTSRVFSVAYANDHFYYVATRQPLFYAFDFNEDGLWDLEYKDEMEDGINGNETFYDSPSGLYINGYGQ